MTMQQNGSFICEDCKNSKLIQVHESILKRRYPFLDKFEMKMCNQCGSKYILCPKCNNVLFRVHLSLDPYGVKDICSQCLEKFPLITQWVAKTSKN